MELKRISFCDKVQWNICSNPFKKHLLTGLEDQHRIRVTDRSCRLYQPGRHQSFISEKPYYLSAKSSGNSYWLYFTTVQGVNLSFLIDKKVLKGYVHPRIILARYRFSDSIYQNTLVDGDLVKTEHGWKFIISDLLVLQGNDIRNKSLPKRLGALHNLLTQEYQPDSNFEPCPLQVKQYFPCNAAGFQEWEEHIRNVNYRVQGLMLTSALNFKPSFLIFLQARRQLNHSAHNHPSSRHSSSNHSPAIHTSNHPSSANSSDNSPSSEERSRLSVHFLNESKENQVESKDRFTFQITEMDTSGIYQLWCNKAGKLVRHSIARVDGLACLQFIKNLFKRGGSPYCVECSYDFDFKKFIPRSASTPNRVSEFTSIINFTKEKV